MRHPVLHSWAAFASLWLAPFGVAAQEASPEVPIEASEESDAEAEARSLFERAQLQAPHLEEAEQLLTRSLELVPRPATAANLAIVHRELGRPLRALEMFERVLADGFGTVSGQMRTALEEEIAETRRRVAVIELSTEIVAPVHIELDGQGLPPLRSGSNLLERVDPGAHSIVGSAPGYEPVTLRLTLEPGEREDVQMVLAPARVADEEEEAPLPTEDSASLTDSPWFWVATGVGVLAIAGGVVAAILLNSETVRPPIENDLFGVVRALR